MPLIKGHNKFYLAFSFYYLKGIQFYPINSIGKLPGR